jgi:hypothetical protein
LIDFVPYNENGLSLSKPYLNIHRLFLLSQPGPKI